MFHSRTGIIGLDFLEDNDALISVKHRRMQLRDHWVSLFRRTRDPSALYVMRNREVARTKSEARDSLNVGRRDSDQILSTPSDQRILSPSLASGAAASPRIPTIAESAEEDSPKCPSCECVCGISHANDSLQKMLSSCAQLTQKLEECVATLVMALSPSSTPPPRERGVGGSGVVLRAALPLPFWPTSQPKNPVRQKMQSESKTRPEIKDS